MISSHPNSRGMAQRGFQHEEDLLTLARNAMNLTTPSLVLQVEALWSRTEERILVEGGFPFEAALIYESTDTLLFFQLFRCRHWYMNQQPLLLSNPVWGRIIEVGFAGMTCSLSELFKDEHLFPFSFFNLVLTAGLSGLMMATWCCHWSFSASNNLSSHGFFVPAEASIMGWKRWAPSFHAWEAWKRARCCSIRRLRVDSTSSLSQGLATLLVVKCRTFMA